MNTEEIDKLINESDLDYLDILKFEDSLSKYYEQKLNKLKDFEFLGTTFKLEIVQSKKYKPYARYYGFVYDIDIVIQSDDDKWTSGCCCIDSCSTPQEAIILTIKETINNYKKIVENYEDRVIQSQKTITQFNEKISNLKNVLKDNNY